MSQNKRARGTGSVRQRGPGRWQLRWESGSGRHRRHHSETVRGTKSDAESVLRERLTEWERAPVLSTDPRLTVAEWLQHWLEHVKKPVLAPTTFEDYGRIVDLILTPGLGDIRLNRLGAAEVQRLVNALAYQPHWCRQVRAVLRSALTSAMKQGLITRNVATMVEVPSTPRREIAPLTPEEARAFLKAIEGDRLEALYQTAMATGMRQGELLGLRWNDVDFERGVLVVRRALKHTRERGYFLGEPKTAGSSRTLVPPTQVMEALRTHKDKQRFEWVMAAHSWVGDDWNLVFARPDGHPLNTSAVTQRFQRVLAEAGLPRKRFHDLRHGAATYLLAKGVPMKVVQDVLGHTQLSTTADIYTHVMPELQRDASEKVGEVLFG